MWGEILVCVYVHTCTHPYSVKQHQSAGWSTGALPPLLSHCWNAPWQPFGSHHLPGSQPGLSAGVTPAQELRSLLLLEAESAHTYGQAPDRGSWPRPTGGTSARAAEAAGTSPGIARPGVLSGKAFLQRASNHGQKQRWAILQCTSLVAWALRKMGSYMQVSPFKRSSMTASKRFLAGSRPLSTCSLYILD